MKNRHIHIKTKPNAGKSSALNYGISKSKGEIVICVDADTVILKDAIRELVKHFKDPRVAVVAGNVKIANSLNILTTFQDLEYINGPKCE